MNKLVSFLFAAALVVIGAVGCNRDTLGNAGCEKDRDCPPGHKCVGDVCQLQCGYDGDPCSDQNPCTQDDACQVGKCIPGTPLADGTSCEADGNVNTPDLCLAVLCVPSRCGDGWLHAELEECDDGNSTNGDGCESDCTIVPPQLAITFPERGATLSGNGGVTVRGTAGDAALGLSRLTVNGMTVAVQANGAWAYEMASTHGLNYVDVVATNNANRSTRRTVAYYYAAAYRDYAAPMESTAKIEAGMLMRLGQEVIDDGDHPCTFDGTTYTCTEIDDIATLGEVVLNNLDLSATLGDIPVYNRVTNFLTRRYPFDSGPNGLVVSGLRIQGEVVVTGDVTLNVRVTNIDFNALALAMAARSGGLDAEVSIDEWSGTPGLVLSVRSTALVDVIARFDRNTLVVTYNGNNYLPLVCLLLQLAGWADDVAMICPDGNGNLAPIASLNPSTYADSTLAIQRMLLETGFDVYTAPGGGVEVRLVGGTVDFLDSNLDLDPIQNATLDLGVLDILGFEFDLGDVPLGSVTDGLNTLLAAAADLFLDSLQPLVEAAIQVFLLNPDDPLAVGSLLEAVINTLAVNGPMTLSPFAGQTGAPEVAVASTITSVVCEAPDAGDLNTGGITPGLDVLYTGARQVTRAPLGSVLAGTCYGDPPPAVSFPETRALEMAHHLDAVNQTLYAVWNNGGFNFSVDQSHLQGALPAGYTTFALVLDFYTAPILSDCDGRQLGLQTADLKVSGHFTSNGTATPFAAFVSLDIPVDVVIMAGRPALRAVNGREPFYGSEVVSTPALDAATTASLDRLVEHVLVSEVLVPYVGDILAALPAFAIDLTALSTDPAAAVLQFEPITAVTRDGYSVLGGGAGQY